MPTHRGSESLAEAPRQRRVPVVTEPGDAQVTRGLIERDGLGLLDAGLQDRHLRPRLARGPLEVGQHRPRQAGTPGPCGDIHPLDLGGVRGLEGAHVVAPSPGSARGWLAVEIADDRSEEHTSELQSLMRTSYADF